MKLYVYESNYIFENFDRGHFNDYTSYLRNIANIIICFKDNNDILFPIEEDIFYNNEYKINRLFIKYRIQFVKKYWTYNIPLNRKECPRIIWYKVEGVEEIIEVLRDDLYCFNCVILKRGNKLEDASYILDFNEEIDFNSLSIRERNRGEFINKILPEIELYLNEKLQIIKI